MSMDKVQLKQEELLDGQVVLSDINPVTNTKSIEDSANGLPMTETISRMWSAINNKLSRIVNSVNGRSGVVVLTSEDVGLGNVDNVSYEEIKQWVLDTFDELFGEGHFRLYPSLTAAKIDAASHGREYNNIPFYAQSGEPITKDINGVTQLIQDYRAYIGYFVWNTSTGHVDIGDIKAISVVGWSDNSIVYVKDEDETFRGNTTPLPIGGIGVNIHVQEDALFVRNPDGIKSESGLAIDKSKVVPRVYYFSQIYRGHDTTYTKPEYPGSVYINPAHNGFLWDEGQGTPYRGPEISIMIDGVTASGTHYLQLDSEYHVADYRVGDLIICNFNGEFSDRGTEANVRLVPEQSDKQFVFRNTSIGVITSAPSLDHPDDPYSVSFNAILPRVGYGLRLIDTHKDDVVHDKEIALYIANGGNYSDDVFNATPFNTRKDVNTEQNPSGVKDPLRVGWEPHITVPWDYDEGGNSGTRVTIKGGLFMEMDKTLCVMPMNMVRAGNPTTDDEGPMGAEYKFIDYGDAGDRMTRPYGSRIAGNWHHPYIYHDDDDPTEAYSNNKTLLSVNLTKIIRDDTVPSHGSYRSFYNVSGLRVDWGTDIAYNGRDESHNNRVVNGLHNITNAFSSENGRNYFGLIDGYDSIGNPYRTLIPDTYGPSSSAAWMKFSGGISVNIGRFMEIKPAVTHNSQEYYDGGRVQLRAGHGTEETTWYRIMLRPGDRWNVNIFIDRPYTDWSSFMKIWDADPENTDPDYQFFCVPKFVANFLLQPGAKLEIGYDDWLCDEEPFLRNNIVDVPTVSEFELIEDTYFPLTDEEPPLHWFNSSYTSYFAKDASNDTFSRVEGVPDPRYTGGLRGPDYHANKYYRFAPPDWPVSIPVSSSDESYDAYNVTFPNDTTQSPFDVVVTAKYASGTKEYHEIFFTKQGDKYVPVNFTVTDVVDEYPIRDKYTGYEWHKTSPEFQPGTFYRLKRKRVDPEILAADYAIVWKQPTNRLGFKPDRETLKINPDGSVGVLTAVTQYKKGSVYHKNQMVESGGKVYICVKDYLSSTYNENVHDTVIAENMPSMYTDTPTYVSPDMYGTTDSIYYAESVAKDMERGYLSNRFSMDAVVQWDEGQSYALGQLVQYMGYLYLVIKSYGDYKSISIEDDIDNGYLSDAFNTSKRKILYFRDIRGRSFEFDPMGTIKQRNNEEKYANDPEKLRRIREYEYVKLGPGLRITGGSLPPEVECNKTELRASLLEEVERMSVAEEIMYARTLDPTFGTSAKFEYQSVEEQNSVVFTPGSMYTMGQYIRSGSYLYLCIKNYDDGSGTPYVASDSATQDVQAGYLAEYSKIYNNAGTIEALTSIEDVMNLDDSFLATIETIGENVDEAIIKNTVLSKDSTLTELRTFKATLDTIRMQIEDPKVFFPLNKEYLLDDWRTLQNRVRAMVLTANNKKDASTTLYPALIQQWFGNGSTVQPTFKAIQAATNDFLQVEIRTLEWLFTTWATMVRNSFELAATFVDDQNANKCDYCACGDADVICNHQCAHCTKNPENNENAYWAYVQVDSGTTHDAVIYDSLNTETHREIFRIPYGTRVVCIPLNSVADWVKVALNGQIGYALKSNFKLAQVFAQISETAISASVNIFDTYDGTGRAITLYNDSMIISDDTKLGVFHTYVTDIPKHSTLPDQRQWEILNSEWTRITLMNDDGAGYTTGYVETARLIFT